MEYTADPTVQQKVNQIIAAACIVWGITEAEFKSNTKAGRGRKNNYKIVDARGSVVYIIKHDNYIKIPRIVLAPMLGIESSMVSKDLERTGRCLGIYEEMRNKVNQIKSMLLFQPEGVDNVNIAAA